MSTENFKNKSFKANQMSKCPFTGAGTPAKFSAGRGQTVRDFWPNSLNLKILVSIQIYLTLWIKNLIMQKNLKN